MARHKRIALLLAGCLLSSLFSSALEARAQTSQSPQTTIWLSAYDKQGRPVTLRKEDVRLLENGAEQEIASLERASNQLVSLVMMMDLSMSQERILPSAKLAADGFLSSVIRHDKDSIGVVSFTGEPKAVQGLTKDLFAARRTINELEIIYPQGYISGGVIVNKSAPVTSKDAQSLLGSTPLWDAVIFACQMLGDSPPEMRRAILLFSDGVDTSSRANLSKATEAAQKAGVALYFLALMDEQFTVSGEEKSVTKLAERTGGRSFNPKKVGPLREALAQIAQDLRSPLVLNFSSTKRGGDGSFRKIKIEIINPELRKQGLRLYYQQGYFAR